MPTLKQLEISSLVITPFVLALSIMVLIVYGPQALRAVRHGRLATMEPHDCLIIGIVIGFTGKLVDNAFWFVPWLCSFLGSPDLEDYFHLGIIVNLPFRQCACIASAFFHLLAAVKVRRVSGRAALIAFLIVVCYIVSVIALVYL